MGYMQRESSMISKKQKEPTSSYPKCKCGCNVQTTSFTPVVGYPHFPEPGEHVATDHCAMELRAHPGKYKTLVKWRDEALSRKTKRPRIFAAFCHVLRDHTALML